MTLYLLGRQYHENEKKITHSNKKTIAKAAFMYKVNTFYELQFQRRLQSNL